MQLKKMYFDEPFKKILQFDWSFLIIDIFNIIEISNTYGIPDNYN